MKRITTLIMTSLALLTMTSSAMAEEVMEYNDLTPTFEFEIKVGDDSQIVLPTELEYKDSKGNIAYKDVDCALDKGFLSKTIDCKGLPLIDIYANDLKISNGFGKFKVRVGDLTNFNNLPTGSNPLRMLVRTQQLNASVPRAKGFIIINGRFICEPSVAEIASCDNTCDGYGGGDFTASYRYRQVYTADGVALEWSVRECRLECKCNWLPPEYTFLMNNHAPACY